MRPRGRRGARRRLPSAISRNLQRRGGVSAFRKSGGTWGSRGARRAVEGLLPEEYYFCRREGYARSRLLAFSLRCVGSPFDRRSVGVYSMLAPTAAGYVARFDDTAPVPGRGLSKAAPSRVGYTSRRWLIPHPMAGDLMYLSCEAWNRRSGLRSRGDRGGSLDGSSNESRPLSQFLLSDPS